MQISRHKGLLYTIVSIILIFAGTLLAIQYAKGSYRVTKEGFAQDTGLLSVNSIPTGAQVLIDDELVTATNDTVYLKPGQYQVKIAKDGYSSWEKSLLLESELVTQTNARLFPSAPSITPLTFTGVENLSTSPDGQKILFFTASNSAEKNNGLYILDLADNTLSLQKGPRQIAPKSSRVNMKNCRFIWSPDSLSFILIDQNLQILLDATKKNDVDSLPNIASQSKQILDEWEAEMFLREQQFLAKFPEQIIKIATQSAQNVYFSPDKKRLLYTATKNVLLNENLVAPLPAANTQTQVRAIQSGDIYVYDREEDRNFKIGSESIHNQGPIKSLLTIGLEKNTTPSAKMVNSLQDDDIKITANNFNAYHTSFLSNTLQWHPDSKHLISGYDNQVKVIEYDGTNATTLYSGPFAQNFVYPWPNGSRLLILTSFSPNAPLNLYAVELE